MLKSRRAAKSEQRRQRRGRRIEGFQPEIAIIHPGAFLDVLQETDGLFELVEQSVAVERIVVVTSGSHYQPCHVRNGDARFGTEFLVLTAPRDDKTQLNRFNSGSTLQSGRSESSKVCASSARDQHIFLIKDLRLCDRKLPTEFDYSTSRPKITRVSV